MPVGPHAKTFGNANADTDADDAHISSDPEVDGGTFGEGTVTIDGVGAGAALSLEHAITRHAESA
jgi:hypothetical protein